MLKLSYFFAFLLVFFSPVFAASKCPVCGMDVRETSKIIFQFAEKENKTEVCSFVCASRYHRKHSDLSLTVKDFSSTEFVDVKKAYFLVKSKNILKEVDTRMLPPVIGFKSEQAALEMKKRLNDGDIVQGFDAAVRVYE